MTMPQDPALFRLPQEDGRVIFHHGILGAIPKDFDPKFAHHLGPYQVTEGAKTYDVPKHWWQGEWTHRPNPIRVIRSPAQIVAANRMFPVGNIGIPIGAQPKRLRPYLLMGAAWITVYMPTTGERPDIGLMTDASAYAMMGADPSQCIDAAQAAGSCVMHFQDEHTGKPIDLRIYSRANVYSQAERMGSPWFPAGPLEVDSAGNTWPTGGGGWVPQQAHYCEMSYMAHQLTGDMGFLRDLQFSANHNLLCDTTVTSLRNLPTPSGELRGLAWAARNLFMAHTATKDAEDAGTLPANCLESDYWAWLLENTRTWYEPIAFKPSNDVFRMLAGEIRFGPWQYDYLLLALAFGILTGHKKFIPLYLRILGNLVGRLNPASGYPPGYGTGYYFDIVDYDGKLLPSWGAMFDDFYKREQDNVATAAGHGEDYHPYITPAQYAALKIDPLNNYVAMNGAEYMFNTRGAAACAVYLDKLFKDSGGTDGCNVSAAYPNIRACYDLTDKMVRKRGSMNPRAAFGIDAVGLNTTMVQPIAPEDLPPILETPPEPDPGQPPQPEPEDWQFNPVPAPAPGFHPAFSTPDDVLAGDSFIIETGTPIRFNIMGNGKTVVRWKWPQTDWVRVLRMEPDGGISLEEFHASGQSPRLYGCAGLVVGKTSIELPAPFPFPQPENPPGKNSPPDSGQDSPPETPPDAGQDSPPAQPPTQGNDMTTILQGSTYLLTPQIRVPAGAVHYGVKPDTWNLDKTDQAVLTPAEDQQSATIKANVDTTAENLTITCEVFVDQAKQKTITLTETLADLLLEAQSGGFSVSPVIAAGGAG